MNDCRREPSARPLERLECAIVKVRCTKPGPAHNVFLTYAVGDCHHKLRFTRTDRGVEILDLYRACGIPHIRLVDLRGKKVLDAGAGHGLFVLELILNGIDALGIDLFLEPWQRDRRLIQRCLDNLSDLSPNLTHWVQPEDLFCESSMTETPFENACFDVISSFAVFHFDYHSDFVDQALWEFVRITKPGGRILIAPFHARFAPSLKRLENSNPRARVARRTVPFRRLGGRILFVRAELIRFMECLDGVKLDEALSNLRIRTGGSAERNEAATGQ